MWYKIKEGKHRASPLSLGIHLGKIEQRYEVIFDDSCRYDLVDEDQEDWNKLVGWSYGMHHRNSIRLGWKYNRESDNILVCRYLYIDGVRIIEDITEYEIGVKHTMRLACYRMIPKWGYNLGLYFGGNECSPVNLKVWIKKL